MKLIKTCQVSHLTKNRAKINHKAWPNQITTKAQVKRKKAKKKKRSLKKVTSRLKMSTANLRWKNQNSLKTKKMFWKAKVTDLYKSCQRKVLSRTRISLKSKKRSQIVIKKVIQKACTAVSTLSTGEAG